MTERDNILAAELVAGVLDLRQRAEAERRARSDPAFARLVEQWQERLSALDMSAPEVHPDPALWARIEGAIARPSPQSRAAEPAWHARLWSSMGALRAATAASLASVLVFGAIAGGAVYYAMREAVRKPIYVAILVSETNNEPGAVVNAFADGRVEMITLTEINVPPGRVLEIWTLWDRNLGPRSVGLMDRARTVRLDLDKLPPTGPNQLFEITLEPAGGSPIGRPTGPILFKGTTSRPL
jgi:anti-sigma-K factor RskA